MLMLPIAIIFPDLSISRPENQKKNPTVVFRKASEHPAEALKPDADSTEKIQWRNSRRGDRNSFPTAQSNSHNRRSLNEFPKRTSRVPDSPPPDPKFNFLADPSRTGPLNPKKNSRRPRYNSSDDRNSSGKKQGYDGEKKANFDKRHSFNKKDLELTMTGRERLNYLRWKEEREKIDADRLSRQHTADGQWQREWDARKVSMAEGIIESAVVKFPENENRRSARKDMVRFRPGANVNGTRRSMHILDGESEAPFDPATHKDNMGAVDTVRFSFREIELGSKKQPADLVTRGPEVNIHVKKNTRQMKSKQGNNGSPDGFRKAQSAADVSKPLKKRVSQKNGANLSNRRVTICETVTEIELSNDEAANDAAVEKQEKSENNWKDVEGEEADNGSNKKSNGFVASLPQNVPTVRFRGSSADRTISGEQTTSSKQIPEAAAVALQSVEEIEQNMINLMNKNIEEVEAVLDTNDVIDKVSCCDTILNETPLVVEQTVADCLSDLLSCIDLNL
ncbi:unnamed protein product [Soboliphyme baturini]|uniref:LIM zinc-binding domain-containing protein n=1 Tax=Soboliphyme baturini TaxID=241478 RepID=A0A183IDC7_9BILA|nr:unnamed protein product [Soboliphyme baturini]